MTKRRDKASQQEATEYVEAQPTPPTTAEPKKYGDGGDGEKSLFVQGACISGLSLLLTYLGEVVFSNILTVATPLVQYQNPIVTALLLGLLLHPTTDRVQAALSKRPWTSCVDGWFDRHGPGPRTLSSAFVLWSTLAISSAVLVFLSIGLVLEGASAARNVAALPGKVENIWTEYVVEGRAAEAYPSLTDASDWLRENGAEFIQPHIDTAKDEASRALDVVQNITTEVAGILRSYGIEAESMPDPKDLIGGQMSHVKEFVLSVLEVGWTTCKSMAQNPGEAWAAMNDIWGEYGDEVKQAKGNVEEVSWVASYGTNAAGSTLGLLRSLAGFFGSILAYMWRSFISAVLFVIMLFKLLQAERPWLEVAFKNFLPGVVPVGKQKQMVTEVLSFATTLLTSLAVKFGLMYAASHAVWVLFRIPFPYTMSLVHEKVHTVTPIGTTGRVVITALFSLYLMYNLRDGRDTEASHWLHQCAQILSDVMAGALGFLSEDDVDGSLPSYARRLTSPGVLLASVFVVAAASAQSWAGATAERWAPQMPWTKYVTFGGALLSVASWLSSEQGHGAKGVSSANNGEAGCDVAQDALSGSIVSPWALTASLALFPIARMNPRATRSALFGS